MTGVKILDIGCNAGLFSIMAAKEKALVVGVDDKQCWIDQAEFVRSVFEDEFGPLDAHFIVSDVSEDRPLVHEQIYDYALAIGVAAEIRLSHGERKFSPSAMRAQNNLLLDLTKVSKNVIIRSREKVPGMSSGLYNSIFASVSWSVVKQIPDVSSDILLTLYSKL